MKSFASIYIGTFEITMKVFEVNKDNGLKEIDSLKMPINIISDVIDSSVISAATTDRIVKILNDLKRVLHSYKVDSYEVYASPTLRQAKNEVFVLEQIKLKCGFKVKVIANSELRFLSYEAIASMEDFDNMISDSAVLVDVGGIALQITLFVKGKIVTTQCLTLGTVSVGENLKRLGNYANSSEQVYEIIAKEVDVFKTMFLKDTLPNYMILLGDQVNYDVVLENEELIQPFILIYKALEDCMAPKNIITPGLSVCDGIAYDYSYRKKWLTAAHNFDDDVLSSAWAIAKRYGSYQPHLKTLFKLSDQIFDVTKKYHGMGKRERLMMEAVAILHDCGKYISIFDSADCSYTIIMSSEILGLTHREREIIASAVMYNKLPLPKYDEVADKFSVNDYIIMVKLLAILKVANALDRSHKQKAKSVKMSIKNDQLIIDIESNASIALEKGMFSKNALFFEQIFSIKPVLKENRLDF